MHRFILCTLTLLASGLSAQSASEFLPPARGGSEEIAKPESVTVTKDDKLGVQKVSAPSTQDAANKAQALAELEDELVAFECEDGGMGLMASASATYITDAPNPTAILYSKRSAYTEAYLQAKLKVVGYLRGLNTQSREQFARKTSVGVTTGETEVDNSTKRSASIAEVIEGSLRAVTIYKIDDDGAGTVSVSAYVTPQCSENARDYAGIGIEAKDIAAGLEYVFDEIRSLVVPPAGSRVIKVRGTSQLAFVGFGSEVIPVLKNPQARLIAKKTARETAQMRARSALVAALQGERITASKGMDSETSSSFKAVEQYGKQLDPDPKTGTEKVDSWVSGFHRTQENSEVINVVSEGKLPPGVNTKTYTLNGWLYSVAVYLPGLEAGKEELATPKKPESGANPLGPRGKTAPDPRKKGNGK